MKALFVIFAFLLLSGCATQFGTRIPHAVHSNAPVASHSPAVAPPVVVPPVASAPPKKQTLRERGKKALGWFFRQKAQQ